MGKDGRWKGSRMKDLRKIAKGASLCLIAAPRGGDLFVPSLLKNWAEWYEKQWIPHSNAGVSLIGGTTVVRQPVARNGAAATRSSNRQRNPLPKPAVVVETK